MPDSDKTKNKGQDTRLSKLVFWLSVTAGAAMAFLMILLGITDKAKVSQKRDETDYISVEDYICQEVEDADAPIGIRKVYTFYTDATTAGDTHLAFYTVHQYVEVWLDGEKVFSLVPPKEKTISRTVGSNWVLLPLYREDAGKEIRVEIIPVYESFRNREVEFLIGSELAIYKDRLSKDLPQLSLSVMAIFVGIVFVCVAGYNQIRKHHGKGMVALGIFSVMMGIWRLTDTRFTPFIFPNHSVLLFYLSVSMLMLGMIPLMKWMEEYFTGKSRRVIDIYCIVSAVVCLIQLSCQFAGVADLRETLYITHIIIGSGVITAIGTAIYEKVNYSDKVRVKVENKLPYLCVAGVIADVVAFYVKGNSSGLLFSLLAFLLYIVIMGIATLFNYSEQELQLAEQERQLAEKERRLAEQDRSLTDSRIKAMMSQIRSHFIFNVLTTISTYCKTDPKKADNALIRFSRYLRKNIKIIEEDGMIDFETELEQVEDYIALEQLRFPQRIVFEKEIRTSSFKLPPLTIQPLVENAIKHGLVGKGRSGTIRLSTMRKEECIEITVTDDGVGFEPETNEKTDSVGIRNVRYRLNTMAEGSLVIDSRPGEGTTATITIPIKESGK
ncbi:MAG: sensor histidine kinase [Lachnospiraceae bacterium]